MNERINKPSWLTKKHRCPVMIGFKTTGNTAVIYCGLWKCERCGKNLARRWAGVVRHGVKIQGGEAHFFTFTMSNKTPSVFQAYKDLKHLWDSTRKAMQRAYKDWHYVAFVEGQAKRNGMPHFHIISIEPIPPQWKRIKDFAAHIGFGFMAHDEIVRTRKAASYVSKYASKGDPKMPKRFRRVRCASCWPKRVDDFEGDPFIVRAKGEDHWAFLARASEVTNVDVEILMQRYQETYEEMFEGR